MEPLVVTGHRLDSVIGSGATSVVWSGTDAAGRPVAIKIPRDRPDPVAIEQAQVERHVLMAVRHEHLVALRDVVTLDDGRPALVFDLVTGGLLWAMVDQRGHLRPGETVTVLTPLCEAVAALHAAGATHGDISARNVMVTADGRPMLLDLGAARVAGSAAGAVFGTKGFVAPEVRRGESPSPRSDVFSLGALAWFCATGNGAPDTDLRLDPETIRSHVGDELATVIGACIDPDPDRRPGAAALARLCYDASLPEPIEVVVTTDEASALTHRLRAQAAADEPEPLVVPRWRAALDRLGSTLHWGAATDPPPGGLIRARPTALLLAALLALLVLVPGVTMVVRSTAAQGPARGHSTGAAHTTTDPEQPAVAASPSAAPQRLPATSPTSKATTAKATAAKATAATATTAKATAVKATGTAPPGGSAKPIDPLTDRASPRGSPTRLVLTLSQRRAEALMRRDVSMLETVHRLASPSFRADDAIVTALERDQLRWGALRPTVARAQVVSADANRAVVRARVDWAAYDVVMPDGTRQTQAAARGRTLDFAVVWLPRGWRLESLSEPSAS